MYRVGDGVGTYEENGYGDIKALLPQREVAQETKLQEVTAYDCRHQGDTHNYVPKQVVHARGGH